MQSHTAEFGRLAQFDGACMQIKTFEDLFSVNAEEAPVPLQTELVDTHADNRPRQHQSTHVLVGFY